MIYKVLGSALIFGASAMMSGMLISREKAKIVQLETYIEMISFVKNRIDLYSEPLGKILSGCRTSIISRLSIEGSPQSFKELIEKDSAGLDEISRRTLDDFADSLGKSYRETQIKLCDKTLGELEKHKKTLELAYASRRKTIIALCLGICGMAVIALF